MSTADSRPAVEHFTQRVFGMPSAEFFPNHQLMLSTLRKALVPAELPQHLQQLAALMLQRLQRSCAGVAKVGCLRSFVGCHLSRIPLLHALTMPQAFTHRPIGPQGCCLPDCLAYSTPPSKSAEASVPAKVSHGCPASPCICAGRTAGAIEGPGLPAHSGSALWGGLLPSAGHGEAAAGILQLRVWL